RVPTGGARVGLQGDALIRVQQRHFRAGHECAGRVRDRAGNRSFVDLAKSELTWEQNEECAQKSDAEQGSSHTHCNAITNHPNTLQCCLSHHQLAAYGTSFKPKYGCTITWTTI